MSFSDNVSDNELAKNCKSATVDGVVEEPRCPTRSEMSEGIAKKRRTQTTIQYTLDYKHGDALSSFAHIHAQILTGLTGMRLMPKA